MMYAGFWRRAIAFIIDNCIIQCILFVVALIFPVRMEVQKYFFKDTGGGSIFSANFNFDSPTLELSYPQDLESIFAASLMVAITWLYYALFQSSKHQATLGMKLFGMRITDYAGKRISFGQATLRYIASWLSGIILGIGYLMIAFTPRKQGLHDYIAKTLVIKN